MGKFLKEPPLFRPAIFATIRRVFTSSSFTESTTFRSLLDVSLNFRKNSISTIKESFRLESDFYLGFPSFSLPDFQEAPALFQAKIWSALQFETFHNLKIA